MGFNAGQFSGQPLHYFATRYSRKSIHYCRWLACIRGCIEALIIINTWKAVHRKLLLWNYQWGCCNQSCWCTCHIDFYDSITTRSWTAWAKSLCDKSKKLSIICNSNHTLHTLDNFGSPRDLNYLLELNYNYKNNKAEVSAEKISRNIFLMLIAHVQKMHDVCKHVITSLQT